MSFSSNAFWHAGAELPKHISKHQSAAPSASIPRTVSLKHDLDGLHWVSVDEGETDPTSVARICSNEALEQRDTKSPTLDVMPIAWSSTEVKQDLTKSKAMTPCANSDAKCRDSSSSSDPFGFADLAAKTAKELRVDTDSIVPSSTAVIKSSLDMTATNLVVLPANLNAANKSNVGKTDQRDSPKKKQKDFPIEHYALLLADTEKKTALRERIRSLEDTVMEQDNRLSTESIIRQENSRLLAEVSRLSRFEIGYHALEAERDSLKHETQKATEQFQNQRQKLVALQKEREDVERDLLYKLEFARIEHDRDMTESRTKLQQLRVLQQHEFSTSSARSARPLPRDAECLPTEETVSDSSDIAVTTTQSRKTIERHRIKEDEINTRIQDDQRQNATHDRELRNAKQRIEQLQKGLDGTGPKIYDLNSQVVGWRSKYEAQCRRTHEQARLKQELLNKLEELETHNQDNLRSSLPNGTLGILSRQSSTNDHLNVVALRMIVDELLERLLRVSPMSLDRKRVVLETTFDNLSNHLDRLPELNSQEKGDISREWEEILDKEYQRAKQEHEARDL